MPRAAWVYPIRNEAPRWHACGASLGPTVDDTNPALPLRTLNYGNYGIFLVMGNAGYFSINRMSFVGFECQPSGLIWSILVM